MNFFQKLVKAYVHAVENPPYAMSVGKGKTMPRDRTETFFYPSGISHAPVGTI